MIDFIANFFFGLVPWWAWAALALLIAGGIWRWVGWQGVVALGFGVAAFFGYRQGYLDGKSRAKPIVPIDAPKPKAPPPKKRRTIQDIFMPR